MPRRPIFAIVFIAALLAAAAQASAQSATPESSSAPAALSDESLDPARDRAFVVSALFSFDRTPATGERQIIVGKRASAGTDTTGWAVAFHQYDSSTRFEVLWKTIDGGGWYTFDHFPLAPGQWYSVTLIAEPEQFLRLYIELALPPATDASSAPPHPTPDRLALAEGKQFDRIYYLGGFDAAHAGVPASTGPIEIGPEVSTRSALRGRVGALLMADVEKAPLEGIESVRYVRGGPAMMKDRIAPDDIVLYLLAGGSDQSRFKRNLLLPRGK